MSSAEEATEDLTVDNIDDLRIRGIRPLVPSACLIDDVTGEPEVYETVGAARLALSRAVRGEDSRLVVVAGPVSAHDPAAALEYANKLKALQTKLKDELIVVMRVFLDEPTGGAGYWSGSMYDPDMDGSFQINKGFRQARQLLLDINRLGLPVGCLYLDTISPQFIADLVSWSCISGRSVQSELHRELASGLSTPVGFQAVGEGALAAELAVDAVRASGAPHAFLSVSKQGVAGIVETTGNKDCHVVLQAGDADALKTACAALEKVDKAPRCMLDCPDAASAHKVASLVSGGGRQAFGVLLPSFLKGGAQVLRPGGAGLTYGQSVTAPCMDWAATEAAIEHLASAIRQRRAASAPSPMGRAPSAQDLRGFDEGSKIESTDNLRVRRIRPLLPPGVCIEEADADAVVKASVFETRCEVSAIMHAEDDRLVVVVGPEAIHDRNATMEYAARLKGVAEGLKEELLVIMQVNFESATASSLDGWKGLINDPDLDGSYHINKGFRQARQLLLDINRLGLPCGCEYLDTITPQYLADLVSWAFVGERTCASRAHRELASGLSTPVGFFKDSVRDAIRNKEMVALDAVRASGAPHAFLSVSKQGVAGIVETTGNKDCHVVLPPNEVGTKLPAESAALAAAELPTKVMVHCKVGAGEARAQTAQMAAVQDVAELVAGGSDSVLGVLLPSFLLGGKQPLRSTSGDAASSRIYGMSVTEPCLDWTSTADALERLAASVRQRRAAASAKKPRTK